MITGLPTGVENMGVRSIQNLMGKGGGVLSQYIGGAWVAYNDVLKI